jgi:hypothetical protein
VASRNEDWSSWRLSMRGRRVARVDNPITALQFLPTCWHHTLGQHLCGVLRDRVGCIMPAQPLARSSPAWKAWRACSWAQPKRSLARPDKALLPQPRLSHMHVAAGTAAAMALTRAYNTAGTATMALSRSHMHTGTPGDAAMAPTHAQGHSQYALRAQLQRLPRRMPICTSSPSCMSTAASPVAAVCPS